MKCKKLDVFISENKQKKPETNKNQHYNRKGRHSGTNYAFRTMKSSVFYCFCLWSSKRLVVGQLLSSCKRTGEKQKARCLPNAETKQPQNTNKCKNTTRRKTPRNLGETLRFQKMKSSERSVPLHDEIAFPQVEGCPSCSYWKSGGPASSQLLNKGDTFVHPRSWQMKLRKAGVPLANPVQLPQLNFFFAPRC